MASDQFVPSLSLHLKAKKVSREFYHQKRSLSIRLERLRIMVSVHVSDYCENFGLSRNLSKGSAHVIQPPTLRSTGLRELSLKAFASLHYSNQ